MKLKRSLNSVSTGGWFALLAAAAHAGPVDISTSPLATSAATDVKPNLMFVLDDSGSMNFDFLPDWANDSLCRSSGATSTSSGGWSRACCQNDSSSASSDACFAGAAPFGQWRGHPPYLSSDFNGLAYNPAVTYRPPLNADGSSWNSQTSANTGGWTTVRNDAYGIQNTGSINLLKQFPDAEWCTDSTFTDCLRNGNYVLPGTVGGKAYTTHHATTGSGSGLIAVGLPDAATTESRSFGPHYYRMTAVEYCTSANLRTCQATASSAYNVPAPLRWCNSSTNATAATPAANSCQAVKTSTYSNARYPTKVRVAGTPAVAAVPAVPAKATFTLTTSGTCNGSNKASYSAVTVNSVNLLASATASSNSQNTIAGNIRSGINATTATTGYSASGSNNTVTISAPVSAGAVSYTVSLTRASGGAACIVTASPATPTFSGYVAPVAAVPAGPAGFPGSFTRVDILSTTTSYPKAATRTDCAGSSCTYAEEMTNFANWWTYYHSRMQSMKSSASVAFAAVSDQFRLGYISINNSTGSDFLNLNTFSGTPKSDWFTKLRAAKPNSSTPLRTALSKVGRLYAGKLNGTSLNGSTVTDPMQYSCQQNFTLLSTDGYWNETATPTQLDGSTAIGDQDSTADRPMKDGTATANTLADVAAYYYNTDLRNSSLSNCSGSLGGDVCEDNVPIGGLDTARHQHMSTFTLGLGTSGFMQFQSDYRSATSGDYFAVVNGSTVNLTGGICTWQSSGECNWPVPANNTQTTIDDLWHAAVNGRGTYFSATDPSTLYVGLKNALVELEKKVGAAAAATTSNPNVSSGDNFVFISNYTSVEWTGELLGKQINLTSGVVEDNPSDWSARTLLDAKTARSIYAYDSTATNGLKTFDWDNLSTTQRGYFSLSYVTAAGRALSQFCTVGYCLSSADQAAAAGKPLVDYLRGVRTDEGTEAQTTKYFRERKHLLGDIVNSEAVYVRQAMFNYVDGGYTSFKASTATRRPMVYVGANDGMLHAFDATNGDEVWAYVPSAVMPNLYRLADKNYAGSHRFFVDSTPTQGDVKIGSAWHTLLVGGLGAGGRAYYALDITDPDNPKGLWEFSNDDLGLTLGRPEITKLADGTWVVLVPSGYNNTSPGNGRGLLFVLDAATGTLLRTIDTGSGSTGTPAGLGHIRAWVDSADLDNTTLRVYGGDNLGNLWRFDVNGNIGVSGYDAQLLATLKGPSGNAQPVTARPELGLVDGNAMVYVGTGRYLGVADLSDTSVQSIYAIKDRLGSLSWGTPRDLSTFVQQTLTDGSCPTGSTACVSGETVRIGSSNAVNLATASGWYVDLPITSERANNEPQLALGTLVVTTNIVNANACTAGGTSYINFFDYRTGGAVSTANGVTSVLLGNALSTRPTVIRLPSGKIVSVTRLFDDRTVVRQVPVPPTPTSTRRLSWRELVTEQ